MLAYYLAYLLPVMLLMVPRKSVVQNSGLIWFSLILFYTIFIGLRHHVGGDWVTYNYYYDYVYGSELIRNVYSPEPGYAVVNWIASYFDAEIYLVNVICAFIFLSGLIAFCRRQPIPLLAFTVAVPYVLVVIAMGYTRQAAALGFIFLSINAFLDNKIIRFIAFVFLAATFHKSAIIMFPIVAFSAKHDRFIHTVGILTFVIMFWYIFLADHYESLWENYVLTKMESDGGLIRVLMNFVPSVLLIIYWNRFKKGWPGSTVWGWWALASIICLPLVGFASTAVDRIALYFTPIQIAIFSRLPLLFGLGEERKLIIISIIAYYAIVMYVWLNYATHSVAWIPYQNLLTIGL